MSGGGNLWLREVPPLPTPAGPDCLEPGSSRARSQQTLQPGVSVLICFSCYFLHGGKGLDPGPCLRWGRLSQGGLSPRAREGPTSPHMGAGACGVRERGGTDPGGMQAFSRPPHAPHPRSGEHAVSHRQQEGSSSWKP